MKIPTKLLLGGHEIKVEFLKPQYIKSNGEYSDYFRLIKLMVDWDIPESAISETLLHEIIEAIKSINNLEIDHTHLTVLSECLFEVIRRNKLDFADNSKVEHK